jgi:hypothetical protein
VRVPAGSQRPRISEEINDPLKVRVLVLDDGVKTVAITSCDLILQQTVDALEIRQQAEQLSGDKIAACNIMLCCPHPHSSKDKEHDRRNYKCLTEPKSLKGSDDDVTT